MGYPCRGGCWAAAGLEYGGQASDRRLGEGGAGAPAGEGDPEGGLGLPICRVLEIAPSSFYVATTPQPSERELREEELKPEMVQVHEENYGVYGLPKLWRQLLREGYEAGRDQVRRLMLDLPQRSGPRQ